MTPPRDFWLAPRHLRLYLKVLLPTILSLLILLRLLLYTTPYSVFHSTPHPWAYTPARQQHILDFLDAHTVPDHPNPTLLPSHPSAAPIVDVTSYVPPLNPHEDKTLCVGVLSVWRPKVQYVHYALGSLLAELTPEERSRIHLVVFLADREITPSLEYLAKYGLDRLVDAIAHYPPSASGVAAIGKEEDGWWRKLVFDSSNLMHYCARASLPHSLLLEDDTLATEAWYPKLQVALAAIDEDLARGPDVPVNPAIGYPHVERGGTEWIYLRLFTTEWFMGFSDDDGPYFLLWALTLVTLQIYLFARLARLVPLGSLPHRLRHSPWWKPANAALLVLTIALTTAICLLLPLAIGRQNLYGPPPGLTRRVLIKCCTPALLYPQGILPLLADHLFSSAVALDAPATPVDILMEDYADAHGLTRYTWSPSLWQHIGVQQSKKGNDEDRGYLYSLTYERAEGQD